ncbi:hypothetical protein HYV88_02730 [Candidatus Woesearchaeota archaeon]|nr:hypothetical protein [Candidatus Woesearchaeota archaeon]
MDHLIIDKTIKMILLSLAFVMISIFIFNELVTILKTLSLFTDESIRNIGLIAVLLALNNLLSKSFFGIKIV